MLEKYYFEFSKIYGRLMRLEMQIKQRLISSVLAYYKDDVIKTFEKFFYNKDRLSRYNHKTGNSFLAILKNPQITKESQKFIKLINIMFLSDIFSQSDEPQNDPGLQINLGISSNQLDFQKYYFLKIIILVQLL